ncbi:arrestin domain-containing protein 17-like isoform X2 [Osmia bicornis bicornis]|uniref:arrestin domain-containing protein 17-like isoform X2 n=1 Tax=Osmia bicornis bicornis TaxID=1437191 RepID=UPI0010F7CF93|nr:arrestin domain-containing protein 17-like isoform X2 [Osmia bicornis bicornis]
MEEAKDTEADQSIVATLSKSMGFQRIDIVFDHPQQVYYSGQHISGNVHLDLDEPMNALGIRLKCKGEAQVYFTDRSAGIRRKFSAFENYLHVETYLVGDGKEKSMITGGVYPFSLTLPENLPCSFEGRYGRVRYSIRALLDVTTIYRFSTNIIPFTVAPILDLNRDRLAPLPISVQQSKVYMGQTEALSMSMILPVHGYVPGQTIPIRINMDNQSTVVLKKIRIVLKKVEACVDVSEWYYRMFQKNLKLRTTIVIGTIPIQTYETPQKTGNVTEDSQFQPLRTMATDEYGNDTSSLKNADRERTAKPSLSLPLYEKSQIYRSSKPDRDDPTGDEGDSDGEVTPYSPMYRVYKFNSSQRRNN